MKEILSNGEISNLVHYFVNSLSKLTKLNQILNNAIYFKLRPQTLCFSPVESMLFDAKRQSFLLFVFFDDCNNDFSLLCISRIVIVNHLDNLISQSANRTQSHRRQEQTLELTVLRRVSQDKQARAFATANQYGGPDFRNRGLPSRPILFAVKRALAWRCDASSH